MLEVLDILDGPVRKRGLGISDKRVSRETNIQASNLSNVLFTFSLTVELIFCGYSEIIESKLELVVVTREITLQVIFFSFLTAKKRDENR